MLIGWNYRMTLFEKNIIFTLKKKTIYLSLQLTQTFMSHAKLRPSFEGFTSLKTTANRVVLSPM